MTAPVPYVADPKFQGRVVWGSRDGHPLTICYRLPTRISRSVFPECQTPGSGIEPSPGPVLVGTVGSGAGSVVGVETPGPGAPGPLFPPLLS